MGRTGDGKSSLGNLILKHLGYAGGPRFVEAGGALSETQDPMSLHQRADMVIDMNSDFVIIDNPGLCDTDGKKKDEANMVKIIEVARSVKHINLLVLVVNSQADRFDSGMQDAVKLISDSFGSHCLNNLVIVFTKCILNKGLKEKAGQYCEKINKLCQTTLKEITMYAVESHPEEYEGFMIPAKIKEKIEETKRSLDQLLRHAGTTPAFETERAVPRVYASTKEREEAERALMKIRQDYEKVVAQNKELLRNMNGKESFWQAALGIIPGIVQVVGQVVGKVVPALRK